MDKFAVIRLQGKQYRVSEGEEILVPLVSDAKKINTEVLLVAVGEKVEVGTPVLEKAKVTFKVISELEKGDKVRIFKYKAKSRQRKHLGFRSKYTRLLVEKISN